MMSLAAARQEAWQGQTTCCISLTIAVLQLCLMGKSLAPLQVVVTVGVAIATYGEINFVVIGVILQLISVATESTRLTLVQILLQVSSCIFVPIAASLWDMLPMCADASSCRNPVRITASLYCPQMLAWSVLVSPPCGVMHGNIMLRKTVFQRCHLYACFHECGGVLDRTAERQCVACTEKRAVPESHHDHVLHRPRLLCVPVHPLVLHRSAPALV